MNLRRLLILAPVLGIAMQAVACSDTSSADQQLAKGEAVLAAVDTWEKGGRLVLPTTDDERQAKAKAAKAAVQLRVRDGASIRWGAIWTGDGVHYCGFYNAKNGHGAYVGFQRFLLSGDLLQIGEIDQAKWTDACETEPPVIVQQGAPGPHQG